MDSLKPNAEVYVKSWDVMGKVLRGRPGDVNEPENEKFYEVQITRYFRRDDLELEDREAKREERRKAVERTEARCEAARKNLELVMATGGAVSSALLNEYMAASNELSAALGRPPLFIPK